MLRNASFAAHPFLPANIKENLMLRMICVWKDKKEYILDQWIFEIVIHWLKSQEKTSD